MRPIKRILVPVDRSPASEVALRYAIRLADSLSARIRVVHCLDLVIGIPEMPTYPADALEGLANSYRTNLKTFVEQIVASEQSGLRATPDVQTSVEVGYVRPLIQSIAKQHAYDLIVIGTRGAHTQFDEWVGSVSTSLIHSAPCPVLVIPETTTYRPIRNCSYATDLNYFDAERMQQVLDSLQPIQPEMRCVYVQTSRINRREQALSQLRQRIENPKISLHEVFATDVWEGLNRFTEAYDSAWLIMYRPRRSWINQLFHHSETRVGVLRSNIPLLVLNEELHQNSGALSGGSSNSDYYYG